MTDYITSKEACRLLKVSRVTLYKWIKEGIIPAERFPKTPKGRWYIRKTDIPSFMREDEN